MDINRTIQVTNRGFSPVLSIAQGTDMVRFSFKLTDFDIPSGSAAVAYNIQPTGNIVPKTCSISGNTVSVDPPAYYFLRGKNYMQIQITNSGKRLVSFLIEVWCSPNIATPEVVEMGDSTVTQQLLSEMGIFKNRLDNMQTIPEGGTTADAALNDIKVGYDGTTYETPGDAVRGQVGLLNENIANNTKNIQNINNSLFKTGKNFFNPEDVVEYKYISDEGKLVDNTYQTCVSSRIYVPEDVNTAYISYVTSGGVQQDVTSCHIAQYDIFGKFISKETATKSVLQANAYYIIVQLASNYTPVRNRIQVEFGVDLVNYTSFVEYTKPQPIFDKPKTIREMVSSIILNNKSIKIKLIGDSITQGVGGTGYEENGETIVENWKRNPNGYCWANLFKTYVESKYNATVINNGMKGITSHQIIFYWDDIVDPDDDIIICMIGANDRTTSDTENVTYSKEELYNRLNTILSKAKNNGSEIIFMVSPLCEISNETQEGIKFHMEDVQAVINKFCTENNLEYISLFNDSMKFFSETGESMDDYYSDGIHPNDKLYLLMYTWISDRFGIGRKIDGATW